MLKQKISVYFGYKVINYLISWPFKELVKLTILLTTGPWPFWIIASSSSPIHFSIWLILLKGPVKLKSLIQPSMTCLNVLYGNNRFVVLYCL